MLSGYRWVRILAWLIGLLLLVPVSAAAQRNLPERPAQWTAKDLKAALAKATTPEDHARIAQYYRLQAAKLDREAKRYEAFAQGFRGRTGRHCNCEAEELSKQARKDLRLAKSQQALTGPSAPNPAGPSR